MNLYPPPSSGPALVFPNPKWVHGVAANAWDIITTIDRNNGAGAASSLIPCAILEGSYNWTKVTSNKYLPEGQQQAPEPACLTQCGQVPS